MIPDLLCRFASKLVGIPFRFALACLTALAVALISWLAGLGVIAGAILWIFSTWIFISDALDRIVPDTAVAALTIITILLFLPETDWMTLGFHIVFATSTSLCFWALGAYYYRRTGTEGLGLGDAKLSFPIALMAGPLLFPPVLLVSALIGIIAWWVHRPSRERGVAFASILVVALPLTLAAGTP